jgi:hypothetical protein
MWKPVFELYLKALRGGKTYRPVLFDFLMSDHIAEPLAGKPVDGSPLARFERDSRALAAMGYDYAPANPPTFYFISNNAHSKESATMDET